MANTTTTTPIATLDDQFRKQGPEGSIPERKFATSGISALPLPAQLLIWQRVHDFTDLTTDNDPYDEHDFGAIDLDGAEKFFLRCLELARPAAPFAHLVS